MEQTAAPVRCCSEASLTALGRRGRALRWSPAVLVCRSSEESPTASKAAMDRGRVGVRCSEASLTASSAAKERRCAGRHRQPVLQRRPCRMVPWSCDAEKAAAMECSAPASWSFDADTMLRCNARRRLPEAVMRCSPAASQNCDAALTGGFTEPPPMASKSRRFGLKRFVVRSGASYSRDHYHYRKCDPTVLEAV